MRSRRLVGLIQKVSACDGVRVTDVPYKGYAIEMRAEERPGGWIVAVRIATQGFKASVIRDLGTPDVLFPSREVAEVMGLQLAQEWIDAQESCEGPAR